ncbi:hypothetical protein SNEBB_001629 [Seison nebaliae]|nr:hypothetical protein SNEBB_001629 [Seison nebaliae]
MYNQLFNDFPFVQHSSETSSSDEEQDNEMNRTIERVATTTATPKRNVDILLEPNSMLKTKMSARKNVKFNCNENIVINGAEFVPGTKILSHSNIAVFRVNSVETQGEFCCKKFIVNTKWIDNKIHNEISLLKQLQDNSFVIKMICCGIMNDCYYLIMENGICDIVGLINRSKEIDFKDYHLVKQWIYRQMITALEAIHNLHIVHCDIKLQNFVVGRNNRLLLIDFGDAKIGKRVEEKYVWENNGQVGTFEFMAPEIYHQFDPATVYTPAVDIWASGIVLYILTYAQIPLNEGNNRLKTFEKLSEGRLPLPDMLPQNLPDEPFYDNIVNVIRCACCPLPEYRLSANDLLKSNYLVNAPVFCPLQF